MEKIPFKQRFGLDDTKLISDDFPESARIALFYLIKDMIGRGSLGSTYSESAGNIVTELYRTLRQIRTGYYSGDEYSQINSLLKRLEWYQVFIFCERVYNLLGPVWEEIGEGGNSLIREEANIDTVRKYYNEELNNILLEENINYQFIDGQFQRRGRPQTQKSIQQVGLVLTDHLLANVREHFNNARKFFNNFPNPDVKNSIKEALCALEACIEVLTNKPASQDFDRVVKELEGNGEKQIPSPIAQSIIKTHAYRGSGKGVAHASLLKGTKVTEKEAELILSQVANYITYLYQLYLPEDDKIPF